MNLMETIHLHKNDFSKTEHKVYDYIVQNPTAIETATITKIAELCQVSTSGILRFCQVLGYNKKHQKHLYHWCSLFIFTSKTFSFRITRFKY